MRGLSTLPSRRGATVGALGPIHVRSPRTNVGAPRRADRPARARRAAAELPPGAVEQIAHRVVELLRLEGQTLDGSPASGPELLNAAELARRFGLTRTWVYENAGRLGAIQLSDGPRPRLRFDPQVAAQALRRRGEQVPTIEPPRPAPTRRRRTPTDVTLLPVYDPRGRGVFARWRPVHRVGRVLGVTEGRA